MKILQLSSAEFLGGGERHLADLANALVARSHEVYAAIRPNSPLLSQLSIPHDHVLSLTLRNSVDVDSARRLAAFVRQREIDIVHAHMARDYPLAAYACRGNRGSRLIVTRHVLFPLSRLHKLTLSRVAKVIAVSEAVSLQLRSEKIIPGDRIAVVLNGVDVKRFEKAAADFKRAEFLTKLDLPADALLVGTVGEIKALKGQEEFLQACAKVAQRFSTAYFIVAGVDSTSNQQQRRLLEQLSSSLALTDKVRFISWLDNVADLYCALDVFVSASRAESFGLAMAEAMATGTAVVATETDGAKQLIAANRTGVLVPIRDYHAIGDAVGDLLSNPDKKNVLAKAGQTSIRNEFSLDRMVDATEAIYRQAIGL